MDRSHYYPTVLSVLAMGLAGSGCAPKGRSLGETPEAFESVPMATRSNSPRFKNIDVEHELVIQRVDAGLGSFLSTVEVEAQLEENEFLGWKIIRHDYPDVDLLNGDVIVAVNGASIETPVAAFEVWKNLSKQSLITIDGMRGDQPIRLSIRQVIGDREFSEP